VKIAIVALPVQEPASAAPPLPLGYVAAWLEQQRHIVRIYDLALSPELPFDPQLDTLKTFRPNIVLVAAEDRMRAADVRRALADINASWMIVEGGLRGPTPAQAIANILPTIDTTSLSDDQRVILNALKALTGSLDELPVPARHILPVERYGLTSPTGALQTNVLIGQMLHGRPSLRNPRTIVAELRSILHENGVWHMLFEGLPITEDAAWLHDFLYGLMMERLGVNWEATAHVDVLSVELLKTFRRAGCEGLIVSFDAMKALDSQAERVALSEIVREAHSLNMRVRGNVTLEPRYSSIPALVDLSATFGLDEVRFSIQASTSDTDVVRPALDLAESHYRSIQARQRFVERYGEHLGAVIWRFGRIGLLGRGWQRFVGGDA
jgi:hypothetical protein